MAVIAALFGFAWINHGVVGKAPAGNSISAGAPVTNVTPANPAPDIQPAFSHTPVISQDEMQRLRDAQDAALQANPDLVAEQKEINSEIQAQLAKMDAAAIKADPKVAPIMARLNALRHPNRASAPPSAPVPR